jgi:CRISPR-associated protein Csx3
MAQWKRQIFEDFMLIEFSIDEDFSPAQLRALDPPDPVKERFAQLGVILSGRGPVWLYGYLIHFYHPTKFIATYDPRLEGAVVIESHGSKHKVGDVIPLSFS